MDRVQTINLEKMISRHLILYVSSDWMSWRHSIQESQESGDQIECRRLMDWTEMLTSHCQLGKTHIIFGIVVFNVPTNMPVIIMFRK